jgi:cytoskeletal protein CcmA (bactofilin family)
MGTGGDEASLIGRSTQVRGHLRGSGDLEIQGRVEGDVQTDGDVVVADTGEVFGDVSGAAIRIEGTVAGAVTGTESVQLGSGARVQGDLRAPRVGIADGALYRGSVETDGAEEATGRSAARQKAAPRIEARGQAAPAPARPAPARPAAPAVREVSAREERREETRKAEPPRREPPRAADEETVPREAENKPVREETRAHEARAHESRVQRAPQPRPEPKRETKPEAPKHEGRHDSRHDSGRHESKREAQRPTQAALSFGGGNKPSSTGPGQPAQRADGPRPAGGAGASAAGRQPPPPVVPALARGARGRKKKVGAR